MGSGAPLCSASVDRPSTCARVCESRLPWAFSVAGLSALLCTMACVFMSQAVACTLAYWWRASRSAWKSIRLSPYLTASAALPEVCGAPTATLPSVTTTRQPLASARDSRKSQSVQ